VRRTILFFIILLVVTNHTGCHRVVTTAWRLAFNISRKGSAPPPLDRSPPLWKSVSIRSGVIGTTMRS